MTRHAHLRSVPIYLRLRASVVAACEYFVRTMTIDDAIAKWEATKARAVSQNTANVNHDIALAPAPVLMERYLNVDGFVDRDAYPLIVERISVGSVIFSRSYSSDAWIFLKNNHIILSLFLAHPKHPFSRIERGICLFCSILMGFGLTCAFNLITKEPDMTIVSVVVGGIIQGMYDALLRTFAECLCVQSCPRCIVKCFEFCGRVGMILQFLLGCFVLAIGMVAFLTTMDVSNLRGVSWRFALSKGGSWIVASLVFTILAYHFSRQYQMRPETSRRTFAEKEAHERWNTPVEPWCCGCCLPSRPPSYMWNYYIGENVTYEQLPARAPSYRIQYMCFSCGSDTPSP